MAMIAMTTSNSINVKPLGSGSLLEKVRFMSSICTSGIPDKSWSGLTINATYIASPLAVLRKRFKLSYTTRTVIFGSISLLDWQTATLRTQPPQPPPSSGDLYLRRSVERGDSPCPNESLFFRALHTRFSNWLANAGRKRRRKSLHSVAGGGCAWSWPSAAGRSGSASGGTVCWNFLFPVASGCAAAERDRGRAAGHRQDQSS